jgi:hypothetical protein
MLLALSALAQTQTPPSASEIMRRVAENQDREQKARSQFVYEQDMHRTMRARNGKLLREEFWKYEVLPDAKGSHKKLLAVSGRYWKKGKYVSFQGEPVPPSLLNITLDDDNDGTRDGIDEELFPLTSDQQKDYKFELTGERVMKNRPTYQIRFHPTDPKDYGWAGEALIDEQEFQPVYVFTRLSRKLPLAVRTMLGTDVPGLGFSIQYTRVDKDLWFPATYGTEFELHALYLLHRTISESMQNTNFRRATVESKIDYGESASE